MGQASEHPEQLNSNELLSLSRVITIYSIPTYFEAKKLWEKIRILWGIINDDFDGQKNIFELSRDQDFKVKVRVK